MNISKKQLDFIQYVECCGYIFLDEVDLTKYPSSLIKTCVSKGLLTISSNKIQSTTKGTVL